MQPLLKLSQWSRLIVFLAVSFIISASLWSGWQNPLPSFAQSPLAAPSGQSGAAASSSGSSSFPTPVIGDIIYQAQHPHPATPTPTRIPDDEPPQTGVVMGSVPNSQNWYHTPITLTFVTTDTWTGLGMTWYKFADETEWNRYEYYYPPVEVITEGTHILQYYSQDKNFNTEFTQTTTLNIDLTAPTATHTLNGTVGLGDEYTSPVTLTITAADALSGIDYVETNLNNSGWVTGNSLTVNQAGSHNLAYRAVDLAGNVSLSQTVAFSLNDYLVREAEEPDTVINRNTQTWSTLSYLAGYSGTGYLRVEPDRDELYSSSGLTLAPEVQYNLTLPITGTYTVWLRGSGANGAGDSVYVSLVETGQTPYNQVAISGFPPRQWGWSNRTLEGIPATVLIDVPGDYVLYIWPREDGVSVDRILLTTNGNATPADLDID